MGTSDAEQTAPVGDQTILKIVLMTSTISSTTDRFWSLRGTWVRDNEGGRSAGIDGMIPRVRDLEVRNVLNEARETFKGHTFVPQRVREKLASKAKGKLRRLGVPTALNRTVQGRSQVGVRAHLRGLG